NGQINWAARGLPHDIYSVACGLNVPGVFSIPIFAPGFGDFTPGTYDNCAWGGQSGDAFSMPPRFPVPPTPGSVDPDLDFAQGPMLLDNGLVGAGQKSGMFWAFKRKTGELVWNTQVVPPGITGGMQWGSANDGKRIFVASANSGTALAGAGSG